MGSPLPSFVTRAVRAICAICAMARLLGPAPAALGWTLLVGAILLLPGSETPTEVPWLRALERAGEDKVVHFALFAVLAALLGRWGRSAGFARPLLLAVLLATAYGAGTEALQTVVPGRSAEWLDLVADGVGALAGAVAIGRFGGRSVPAVW